MLTEAEYNRFILMAAILLIQGCVLTPIAGLLLEMNSTSMGISLVLAFATIVSNISQMSMKAVLPIFLLSVLANLILILIHLI
ncbi:hypothetical protein BKI52_17145 [marine bacterium AO1-C]|nr:hypothetical protein BKI52_17145 [marine bacterium AO1-C]